MSLQAASRTLRQLARQQQQGQWNDTALAAQLSSLWKQVAATSSRSQPGGAGTNSRSMSAYARAGNTSSSSTSSSSAGSGLRRVNPAAGSGSAGDAAASTSGGASTSGSASSSGSMAEMSQEVPGGSRPLLSWERWYWGVPVVGLSVLLYNRLKTPDKTPEEIAEAERKAEELRQRRKDHVRAVLMAQNFLEGDDDPLEGLSPAQIVMFMEKYGIDPTDPLEGLSPEEIDAYMRQQEAKRQEEDEQAAEH